MPITTELHFIGDRATMFHMDGPVIQVETRPMPSALARTRDQVGLQSRLPALTVLALGFAGGICVGWNQPRPWVWLWLVAAALVLIVAFIAHRTRLCIYVLALSAACLGAAWVTVRQHFVEPDDLAAFVGDQAMLVRVRGVATGPPEVRARTAGSMARFDYRDQATYFPIRIDALLARDGSSIPIHGRALVRVNGTIAPFRAGDHIETTGFLLRPARPRNPGEFDYLQFARSLGQAGIITVESRELVKVTPAARSSVASAFLNFREGLRRRGSAWLLSNLPESSRSQRDLLLANLLLGEREEQIDGFSDAFQRVGLSHVLAISGFHLAVLAGFVLLTARAIGGHRAWHGWLVIAVVLLYLALVEVRMPVLRAGVMTVVACLGLVWGRRLRVSGLVALSAITLLWYRPDQLFNAGFQLTFGVVLGLVHLAPRVRRRWFGPPQYEAATVGEMIGQGLKTAFAVSVVAWLIATPIAAYHFGMVSPLGVLLSVVAVPLSAVILALGYLKIVFSALLPSLALVLGFPLTICADALLSIVLLSDAVPLISHAAVPYPSAWWSALALAWVTWWALGDGLFRARRAPKSGSFAALLFWLWLPALSANGSAGELRIDMLAVGDGSCYVVRDGASTAMFDSGSSTDLNVGRRSLVPALRKLNVRHIDALAISHADLDHYSAVLEICDEFDVAQVLVTPQFIAEARDISHGPVAFLMEELTRRRVAVHAVSAGDVRRFGHADWTFLHPQQDDSYDKSNNASMVIRIDHGGARALFCGDIEEPAMTRLMNSSADLRADVVELPHHGSFDPVAVQFVQRVQARVALQSTGWMRWSRDQWKDHLRGVERMVTARDGACRVHIDGQDSLMTHRFLPSSSVNEARPR